MTPTDPPATPPDPTPPGPGDDQVAALGRDIERLRRRLDAFDTARADIAGLAADTTALVARADQTDAGLRTADGHIRALAEAVKRLAGPAAGGLLCWLTQGPPATGRAGGPGGPVDPPARLDTDEAIGCLDELAAWLAEVYLRYPGADLPSCWAWHPAVVEELWWLRGAHIEVYTGKGSTWAKVGDWHDRQRPGVVKRIAGWISTCDLSRHNHPDGDRRDRGTPAVPLAVHLPLVAERWSQDREAPRPDAAALADAERHDRATAL